MKLVSRLVIAFAVCLIAIPALAILAQADEPAIWLSDSSGYVGDEIRLYGEDLSDYYGTVWVYYELNNDWKMVDKDYISSGGSLETDYFEIPESASGSHEIRVCDTNDDYFIYTGFEVKAKLEITQPDDAEGPVGTEVTMKGTGFGEDEDNIELRYYFDGSDYETVKEGIDADEYGSWGVTFTVPASSKGDHKIDAKGDDSSLSEVEDITFEVKPGISVSKSSGSVSDIVTVKGSGFDEEEEDVKITYDDEVVKQTEADENGNWETSFEVPASTKGNHKIDAYGSSTSATTISDKEFTVSPKVTLTPTSGDVGTSLSGSGTGFAGSKSVTVKYDATQVATATSNSKGSFSTSFSAPKSKHGEHTVTVTDASGNTASMKFVMESNPPAKPTLSLPTNGTRIGFISSQTATSQWTAVTDPSGVSYKLQIASDPGFVSLVVTEISGLTETSYTLPQGQALPYGTYYWRVKAIDSAQNDSGWTGAYSFQSGLLPLWAFIIIIVIAVVLIAALLYLLGAKRR
ncbi:MAG: Ig-like domain-containing protein [Chloroflexota bacterium]|nr:Ig-like domain-containing protein [Chloroflexota bacterium]